MLEGRSKKSKRRILNANKADLLALKEILTCIRNLKVKPPPILIYSAVKKRETGIATPSMLFALRILRFELPNA